MLIYLVYPTCLFMPMFVFRYGADTSIDLDIATETLVAQCGIPWQKPVADIDLAVAEAIEKPLGCPPLKDFTTPGDRVVIALDHGITQVPQVTAAVVRAVIDTGIDPDGISVLRPPSDVGAASPLELLHESVRQRITLQTHDPANRDMLAYLAATEAGDPVMINRCLHEADLIVPIGWANSLHAAGYYGIHTGIFPGFSDEKTQRQYRSPGTLRAESDAKHTLILQTEQVAWLLGLYFTIQLVPGPGDMVLAVVAGQVDEVAQRTRELYDAAWQTTVPRRAELVVVGVEGGPAQQTWENVGRAVQTATALVEEDGAIAVCCELAERPGPAMQRLIGAESLAELRKSVRHHKHVDSLPTLELAEARQRARIYFRSRLEASVVEDLGMMPLETDDELVRLVAQHKSCTLMCGAAHVMPSCSDNAEGSSPDVTTKREHGR